MAIKVKARQGDGSGCLAAQAGKMRKNSRPECLR